MRVCEMCERPLAEEPDECVTQVIEDYDEDTLKTFKQR
jgi:hypothetical protein